MKPWISGPKELLDHAYQHLVIGSPFDYRIAMISIDNAVELSIRTYLSLPKRIRGSDGPTRREIEAAFGFPELLNLIESHGGDHLSGIELGDIEWYHRIRNTLYHDGNGVTVEKDKVDAYNQIAQLLFTNLFGTPIELETDNPAATLLGNFILKWAKLEARVRNLAEKYLPKAYRGHRTVLSYYDGLVEKGVIRPTYRQNLDDLSQIRNSVVHNTDSSEINNLDEHIANLDLLINDLPVE